MYHSHMETGNIASLNPQVEEVTNCMLAAFQPSTAGIIWNNFSRVIGNHILLDKIASPNSQLYFEASIYS